MEKFPELRDTLSDLFKVGNDFAAALEDGAQPTDLIVIVTNYPTLVEVYNDRKETFADMKSLATAAQVDRDEFVEWVAQEFDIKNDRVELIVEDALRLLNRYGALIIQAKALVEDTIALVNRAKAA